MRLHIGGEVRKDGWTVLGIQPGPAVDIVSDCTSMPMIADGSCEEVYASHVFEHLGYNTDLPKALREVIRVLRPGGRLMASVPDLGILCWMFTMPHFGVEERYHLTRIIFGGQTNPHDFHVTGFNHELLGGALADVGFTRIRRVESFGLFNDTSVLTAFGIPISLNMEAYKPG
jgi:predicted SAM-dependent methyltransferase